MGASSEIVYSGVRNVSIGPIGTGNSLDIDGDGTVDFTTDYGVLATTDIPSSSRSGQIGLQLLGSTRVLGTTSNLGVSLLGTLPTGFSVGAQPEGFSWIDSLQAQSDVSVGSWNEGLNRPWSGWIGFAAAADPVFGIELHSATGVRYGWVRLRFGGGTLYSTAEIYDWAYESAPGVPIIARAGTGGILTKSPPFITPTPLPRAPLPTVATGRSATFAVSLSGAKAVPLNANPLVASAKLILRNASLSCVVQFPSAQGSDSSSPMAAVLESAEEQRQFTIDPQEIIHSSTSAGNVIYHNFAANLALSPSLADAIRLGNVQLTVNVPGGDIRGQVAQLLADQDLVEPALAGEFSLLLWPPPSDDSTENRRFPNGVGHGSLRISASREVTLTAALSLGGAIRWTGTLDETNTIHVSAKAPGAGAVTGEIQFAPLRGDWVCQGELVWNRPASSERFRFPQGFEIPLGVEGSRFDRNKDRRTHSTLILSRGGLELPIAVELTSAYKSTAVADLELQRTYSLKVTGRNPHRVVLSANPKTGVIRGSFRHPKTGVRIPFGGKLLGDLSGAGSFTYRRASGAFVIEGLAFERFGSITPEQVTLRSSSSDPDVVILTASATAQDTTTLLELIPERHGSPADGIYGVVLVWRKEGEIGAPTLTTRVTTSAFLRPADFRGIRLGSGRGTVILLGEP